MNVSLFRACVIASAAGLTSMASAQAVSLTYDDLGGSYSASTGIFTARAVDIAGLHTSGDVSRLVGLPGTADFAEGFVSLPGPADFVLNLHTLPGVGSPTMGSFTATDTDGDTITGDIEGFWTGLGAHFLAFSGTISDASADLSTNNAFDGETTSFSGTSMPNIYRGAIVQLVFVAPDFFISDFTNRTTGTTIQLIPAPATAALGVMGLGVATRRRR